MHPGHLTLESKASTRGPGDTGLGRGNWRQSGQKEDGHAGHLPHDIKGLRGIQTLSQTAWKPARGRTDGTCQHPSALQSIRACTSVQQSRGWANCGIYENPPRLVVLLTLTLWLFGTVFHFHGGKYRKTPLAERNQ